MSQSRGVGNAGRAHRLVRMARLRSRVARADLSTSAPKVTSSSTKSPGRRRIRRHVGCAGAPPLIDRGRRRHVSSATRRYR